jgi:hypothetical protein
MVARAFRGAGARVALGTYNFAGDIGKISLPAIVAGLLVGMQWHQVLWIVAAIGICVAIAIGIYGAPSMRSGETAATRGTSRGKTFTAGFSTLLAIGARPEWDS